jgi:hypothetical protein
VVCGIAESDVGEVVDDATMRSIAPGLIATQGDSNPLWPPYSSNGSDMTSKTTHIRSN